MTNTIYKTNMINKTLFLFLFSFCFFVPNTNAMEINDIEQKIDETITFVEKTLKESKLKFGKDRKYNYPEPSINELIGYFCNTLKPITPFFTSLRLYEEPSPQKEILQQSDALASAIEALFLIKKMQQNNPTFCQQQYNLIKEFINTFLDNLEILQNTAFFAAKRNTYFCLAFLLQIGIDPNLKDWHKQSLLHVTAQNGHYESTLLLIKTNGININARDSCNRTPLQKAHEHHEKKITDILRLNGAEDFPHFA